MAESDGLRQRKKAACRRALADAARQLARERGVDGFTIGDVTALANVSARTFFNYFATKEDAVIGIDPARAGEAATRLLARPPDESPLDALRGTFVDVDEDLEANAAGLSARIELVHRYPELMPRHLAASHELERSLVEAMATRLSVDAALNLYPTVVVSAGVAALRSTMLWWYQNGRPGSLADHIDDAFDALERGLARPTNPVGRRRAVN